VLWNVIITSIGKIHIRLYTSRQSYLHLFFTLTVIPVSRATCGCNITLAQSNNICRFQLNIFVVFNFLVYTRSLLMNGGIKIMTFSTVSRSKSLILNFNVRQLIIVIYIDFMDY